jgi:hypothetical protein
MKLMLDKLKEVSGDAANRERKNLMAAWKWGIELLEPKLPEPNPCKVNPTTIYN